MSVSGKAAAQHRQHSIGGYLTLNLRLITPLALGWQHDHDVKRARGCQGTEAGFGPVLT